MLGHLYMALIQSDIDYRVQVYGTPKTRVLQRLPQCNMSALEHVQDPLDCHLQQVCIRSRQLNHWGTHGMPCRCFLKLKAHSEFLIHQALMGESQEEPSPNI